MAKLQRLGEIEEGETHVMRVLLDAVLLVEAYRGARHQITFLKELTRSVDHLLRQLDVLDKADELAGM